MLNLFRPELGQQYLWALGWAGLSLVPPFVVFKLLSFAQDLSIYNRNEALFYVASLLAALVLRAASKISKSQHTMNVARFYLVTESTLSPLLIQYCNAACTCRNVSQPRLWA
jgi:FtsH-binding integral membrane protein